MVWSQKINEKDGYIMKTKKYICFSHKQNDKLLNNMND